MKITWVNHASFIFEYDGVKMICDPWIEGTTFDNGWALLSQSVLQYSDFKNITHIWFSHEHPDHFNPPNLNKIPKEYRKDITILFQNTVDRKVAEYCKKAGFETVIEMKSNTYYNLSSKVSCLCNPFSGGDSWMYVKTDRLSFLNLNDCEVKNKEQAKAIQDSIGKVDVLFTQFGYANKVGNKNDIELRRQQSALKLKRVKFQFAVFQPKFIVPFASYIYFCHEENCYMNDGINRIADVEKFIEQDVKSNCVILYPGDEWDLISKKNNSTSIKKYNADYSKLDDNKIDLVKQKNKIDLEELTKESHTFAKKLLEGGLIKNIYRILPTMKIWLSDYQQSFKFNLNKGLIKADKGKDEDCDIILCSEALYFAFKNLYGGDTLNINARFFTTKYGNYKKVRAYFKLASFTNRKEKITLKYLAGRFKKE